jgi:hypothetical protein
MNYEDPEEGNFQANLVKMINKLKQEILSPEILPFER